MLENRGLSVLIPVRNHNVQPLVQRLAAEAQQLETPIEIVVYDDASDVIYKSFYESFTSIPHVRLLASEVNLGRAVVRKQLLHHAIYSHVLFLDADTIPVHSDFLKKYIQQMPVQSLLGGTCYSEQPPTDKQYLLHWKMGRHREMRSAAERRQNPILGGGLNNHLIAKHIALKIRLPELPAAYGYEDALFIHNLLAQGIVPQHIENPVYHLGLDTNRQKLNKTKLAMQNMAYIHIHTSLLQSTPLFHFTKRLYKIIPVTIVMVLGWMVYPVAYFFEVRHASLKAFDICKAIWYTNFFYHYKKIKQSKNHIK